MHHHLHVVLDQDHRDAVVGDRLDQRVDGARLLGIEPRGRLVQEQDAWPRGQRTGDFEALERAVGHRPGLGVQIILEADIAHQPRRLLAQRRLGTPQRRARPASP